MILQVTTASNQRDSEEDTLKEAPASKKSTVSREGCKSMDEVDSRFDRKQLQDYAAMEDCISSIIEFALTCSVESPEQNINEKQSWSHSTRSE